MYIQCEQKLMCVDVAVRILPCGHVVSSVAYGRKKTKETHEVGVSWLDMLGPVFLQ